VVRISLSEIRPDPLHSERKAGNGWLAYFGIIIAEVTAGDNNPMMSRDLSHCRKQSNVLCRTLKLSSDL
jgi:hypothetical protein